jgi:transposase
MEISPSDLTDQEWTILEPLIPPGLPGGRKRSIDMRAVQSAHFLCVAQRLRLAHAAQRVPAALYRVRLFCAVSG